MNRFFSDAFLAVSAIAIIVLAGLVAETALPIIKHLLHLG